MIIVPVYLAVDTDDEELVRVIAEQVDGRMGWIKVEQPLDTTDVDYTTHLIEHRGEKPVLLRPEPGADQLKVKTYLPIPGLKIRRD